MQQPLLVNTMKSNGAITCKTNRPLEYGDLVMLYSGYEQISSAVLSIGGVSSLKIGSFKHADIVGKRFGAKIYDWKTFKWVVVLRPTAEFITACTPHRTQILYHPDISLILMLLDALPGKLVVESGTGSGSLSASLARAIAPTGHLYTYEFHDDRCSKARQAFEAYGLSDVISVFHRNVYSDGFGEELKGCIDSVFLDLPAPWLAVWSSFTVLQDGGHLVNFSPCIEQVQRLYNELDKFSFQDMRTFEILSKPWGLLLNKAAAAGATGDSKQESNDSFECRKKIKTSQNNSGKKGTYLDIPFGSTVPSYSSQYQLPMKSHSGYLTVAIKYSQNSQSTALPE